jgi:DNA-binding IclR family transcriptional regulator
VGRAKTTNRACRRRAFGCTSSLEAWHREDVLERGLPAFASCNATSADELRSVLEHIRGSGYAAISVAGPVSRVGATLTTTLRDEVIVAAERISAEMG